MRIEYCGSMVVFMVCATLRMTLFTSVFYSESSLLMMIVLKAKISCVGLLFGSNVVRMVRNALVMVAVASAMVVVWV